MRPGNGVGAPAIAKHVNPVYPGIDLQNGIDGLVLVEVVIDEEGKVLSSKVLEAPSAGLGKAAASAVNQWLFASTEVDGRRVKVLHTVGINFKP